jgi:hypothetical protein
LPWQYPAAASPYVLDQATTEEQKQQSWYRPVKTATDVASLLALPKITKDALKLLRYRAGATSKIPSVLRKPATGAAKTLGGAGIIGAGTTAINAITDIPRQVFGQQTPAEAAPIPDVNAPGGDVAQLAPGDIIPGYQEPGMPGDTGIPGAGIEQSPADIVQGMIDDALGNLETGNGTPEDAQVVVDGQTAQLNDSVDQALADLTAAYGDQETLQIAVSTGDPILMQQLASIDADYQAGMAQIQANYGAALSQVQGYQAQGNALLADAAAKMGASFEAAAGGLEGMSPSSGMSAAQANAAGVSDTALGGAGVTGAALVRSASGAAQAQGIADQFALGTSLGDQLASGRMTQADVEAALSREALGAKGEAKTASAQRQYEDRVRKETQAREDRQRIADIKYQRALDKEAQKIRTKEIADDRKFTVQQTKASIERDLALKVAGMTPEERADYLGKSAASSKMKVPSWIGKRDPRDGNASVDIKLPSATPATVNMVNQALDIMDAQMQSADARDPKKALAFWSKFFTETVGPDAIAIYQAKGRPTTASAMVKSLF